MNAPTHHLRRSAGGVIHYVDNRTMLTRCGLNAMDWQLVLTNEQVPTCDKCIKSLDNVEIQDAG